MDEQATFDNITAQLSLFADKTKKGDIVYLHFSTHGQPVEDINGSDANSVKAQKYKCVKKFRDKYNELKNKIYG